MIRGYPGGASVAPGDRLVLHVATDAPRFRISVYRWGDGFVPMLESQWFSGQYAEPRDPAADWGWPAYELAIPDHWPSAVYMAHLQEPHGPALHEGIDNAAALFVVRGEGRSPLLYKIPLATYHAYNCTGGGCFYMNPPRSHTPPGSKVSLRRPGGGIGGGTHGAIDHYDTRSPRQTFAHWDAPFIRWLLRNGYAPEFCTDFDIHKDPRLCSRYRLLLSVGHDEYWSEAMRDHVEDYISGGGNVAFFGANLCWWRIHVVDEGTAMVCHQGGPHGALDQWWPKRPEDSLTGVSYRHGGGWWDGPRRTSGYVVQQPEHWLFEGTGLQCGDAFGNDTSPPLPGYECDGAPLARFDEATATLSADARHFGTPTKFLTLAVGLLDAHWQELPAREAYPARGGIHAATMGIFSRNGTVFTTASTDWAQVLASGQDCRVEKITSNVITRLLSD
ncbi:MAG: hypothetical protein V7606_4078 [Burkholderiales bacterium]